MRSNGIIVGCNQTQEWLLSWWWTLLREHSTLDVTFFDFGLSASGKSWCQDRGNFISLPFCDHLISDQEEVSSHLVKQWKRYPDRFWQSRKAWFKKPLACLQSPYEQTIWLDLDCEIVGQIDGLIQFPLGKSQLAIAKDPIARSPSMTIYNSGVIVFRQSSPLIKEWAKQALTENDLFRGDQDLLSNIIAKKQIHINELPAKYNWNISQGRTADVIIYHWSGDAAKALLQKRLIINSLY